MSPGAYHHDPVIIGAGGMNQIKACTRCGMRPCHGRMSGAVAIEVLAEARGVPLPSVEPFPTKPVSVGELTTL